METLREVQISHQLHDTKKPSRKQTKEGSYMIVFCHLDQLLHRGPKLISRHCRQHYRIKQGSKLTHFFFVRVHQALWELLIRNNNFSVCSYRGPNLQPQSSCSSTNSISFFKLRVLSPSKNQSIKLSKAFITRLTFSRKITTSHRRANHQLSVKHVDRTLC